MADPSLRLRLLLGGARSGKSTLAEAWAAAYARVLYVATAQAFDDEMVARIAQHRQARPAHWHTLEAPLRVGEAVRHFAAHTPVDVVLVDCITLLASNALLTLPDDASHDDANRAVMAEVEPLLTGLAALPGAAILVTNEVGMGVVPPYRLGRLYRDALVGAPQRLAQAADAVYLLVAGLPWRLK
jgi:adenosylcobinamide kinase/adenosylcobinamide-phosphate guanylyltransferase